MKAPRGTTAGEVIDVAAGLVFRQSRLLISQRLPNKHLVGLWEFPGGKVEPGETFESCLARELQEELGIQVEVGELLDELTHVYPEKTVRLKFFRCRLIEGEPKPLHCHAVAWVSRDELRAFAFPAADARLLHLLENSPALWAGSPPLPPNTQI